MFKAFVTAAVVALSAAAANAGTFQYSVSNPAGQNSAAGKISQINSSFDSTSKMFTWNVSFSNARADQPNQRMPHAQ